MRNKIVLVAAVVLMTAMAGCAIRFSAEVKNPWHPEVYQQGGTQAPRK